LLSDRTQKQRESEAVRTTPGKATPDQAEDVTASGNSGGAAVNEADRDSPQNMPRWRQIEILRERAQLREALADLEMDEFDEFELEVFGSESENEELYQHGELDEEDDVEFDEDELDDDDLDENLEDDDFDDFDDD
jgi:hypothetical protein